MECRLFTVSELVARGVGGRTTIYKMIRTGQIPSYRIGTTGVRVSLEEVLAALRRPATKR
jgi:excisionase family DNA binding protein